MSEDDSSTLVILLETHSRLWELLPVVIGSEPEETALQYVEQVIAFVRAFLIVSESNKVAIFAVHDRSSPLLYASPSLQYSELSSTAANFPSTELKIRLCKLIASPDGPAQNGEGPALAGAISRVLCFLHRTHSLPGKDNLRKARILCMQASSDVSAQYIAFMNTVFSAQRSDTVIDACMLGGGHSTLLQQACHLTGGIYTRPARPGVLLEYLLAVYAGDTHSRSFLALPRTEEIDFRASCFCHKRAIDLGYVCSVCLSIFCESLEECSTCGTVFTPAAAEIGSKRRAQQPPLDS